MSKVGSEGRSYHPIGVGDLYRLLEISKQDREMFFKKHFEWKNFYGDRAIGVALCQGAAKHYVDSKTGINDFDVYTFYKKILTKIGLQRESSHMILEMRNLVNQ